jgi:CheY-like chemotaxis protein
MAAASHRSPSQLTDPTSPYVLMLDGNLAALEAVSRDVVICGYRPIAVSTPDDALQALALLARNSFAKSGSGGSGGGGGGSGGGGGISVGSDGRSRRGDSLFARSSPTPEMGRRAATSRMGSAQQQQQQQPHHRSELLEPEIILCVMISLELVDENPVLVATDLRRAWSEARPDLADKAELTVIAMSSNTHKLEAVVPRKAGGTFDAVLRKPVMRPRLEAILRRFAFDVLAPPVVGAGDDGDSVHAAREASGESSGRHGHAGNRLLPSVGRRSWENRPETGGSRAGTQLHQQQQHQQQHQQQRQHQQQQHAQSHQLKSLRSKSESRMGGLTTGQYLRGGAGAIGSAAAEPSRPAAAADGSHLEHGGSADSGAGPAGAGGHVGGGERLNVPPLYPSSPRETSPGLSHDRRSHSPSNHSADADDTAVQQHRGYELHSGLASAGSEGRAHVTRGQLPAENHHSRPSLTSPASRRRADGNLGGSKLTPTSRIVITGLCTPPESASPSVSFAELPLPAEDAGASPGVSAPSPAPSPAPAPASPASDINASGGPGRGILDGSNAPPRSQSLDKLPMAASFSNSSGGGTDPVPRDDGAKGADAGGANSSGAKAPSRSRQPMPGNRLRFLVVDDTPVNVIVLKKKLETLGHEVDKAANGLQGFNSVVKAADEGRPFDAVWLDLHMPVLDGFGCARAIRSSGSLVPICAVTADLRPEARADALNAQMDFFVTKPLPNATIDRVIRDVVNLNKARRTRSEGDAKNPK